MRRTIRDGVLTLLLALPAVGAAEPGKWHEDARVDINERMIDEHSFTCSTGDAGSLLVGAAALGTMRRRRR